ncbi:MAG TPA: alpha/beta fold hydrolase [Solirubrobacteraceae bacterium]|nr:alpha/beta fold hydrolase [Solirubrobacteraceae bacterium]
MRLRLKGLSTVFLTCACTCVCAVGTPAQAQIAFAPCGDSNDFACGHVTVPLDPGGATPGTVTLALRRHRAPVGEPASAVIALAGGPGQPALPFAEGFAELLGPIAATRDLIVFDQRGIGLSQPLSCHAFERPDLSHSIGQLIEACASQLGAPRAFYTTPDTVADIEAIRRAGGYEKLVLYGTSYGTKVAEQYAQDYPTHVEALVLDSVVPPNGPDALERPTFAAVPRILRRLCADRACAGVTRDPVADLAEVLRRMRGAPLRGRVIDGEGKPHTITVVADELAGLLIAGDFSPLLRAEFVTSISAAADGDEAPLARLLVAAYSGSGGEAEDFDGPLYFATRCEEQAFPWSRAAAPRTRVAQALAAANALPTSAFAPFSVATAIDLSDIQPCAYWPFATPAPPVDEAPLPNVPALIISGEADLRTPTANAGEVAAQIPDANLLVVPNTGHSALTTEAGSCARDALEAMFAGRPVNPCRVTPLPPALRPPPPAPLRMGLVPPTSGYRGLPGRTLHALALTLGDLVRQLAFQFIASASEEAFSTLPTLRVGGLRAGWAQLAGGALSFHDYTYVPGMSISGTIRQEGADLQVGGAAAAHGTLREGPHRSLVGTLAGKHVSLASGPGATAAIVGADGQAGSYLDPRGAAGRRAARELARLLGGVIQP